MKSFMILLAAMAVMVGCSSQPENGPTFVPPSEEKIEATIKKIEDDPNMTPEAKAAAINAVKSSAERSQSNAGPAAPATRP